MDCPACKEPLAVLEYSGVEVDHCAACGGVWLDEGEVELLFGGASPAEDFLRGLADSTGEPQRHLRCPICGQPMRKAHVAGAKDITVDVSPHGVWFDRGELDAVLQAQSLPPRLEHVAKWLREVFGARTDEP